MKFIFILRELIKYNQMADLRIDSKSETLTVVIIEDMLKSGNKTKKIVKQVDTTCPYWFLVISFWVAIIYLVV